MKHKESSQGENALKLISALILNKGNNKITEHRAIFQRESQNS